jgi:hypothetical protein
MRKKLLLILALTILVASTVVGCDGGSPCSTLTILSITEGEVLVMKEGTDDWVPAEQGVELDIGDAVKTSGNSSAKITFFDGSTMELWADTEIKILSLDIACDTGITTVGLLQTIGTTISRVTAILDPASSHEVETPSGVVGVRGSRVKIQVFPDSWNYEGGATIATNLEGSVYAIAQGVELDVPEGERCIMILGQEPNLMPVAVDDIASTDEHTPVVVDILENDYDPDAGDSLAVESVTQGTHGYVDIIDDQHVSYGPEPSFNGIDNFTYTVSDGRGGTDTATVTVTVYETSARINVTADPGALIYIWDDTLGAYAIDKDIKKPVDGTNGHETEDTITVAGGRYYYVWVDLPYCVYYVDEETLPDGWFVEPDPDEGDDEAAYGYLAADTLVSVSFAGECSY